MSRLTASPFHKPSPFEFPRGVPLSPPETNSEQVGPYTLPSTSASVAGGMETHTAESDYLQYSPHHPGLESASVRLRRGPSLLYHSSGLRESKERTVQRSSRSFIIVIPPSILLQEHGQLGHTLSLGPRHRLAQGMLMPLFPTMYGQLSAIAREFNFPSTTGLCLYFHFSENGVVSTPRISDDSWQMVWSPFLESSPSQRPPICGKIEFDIDLRFARWYSSWMASAHRDHVDVPVSVAPSTAPSVAHFRQDSRVTDLDYFTPNEDEASSVSIAPQTTARHHTPKKLSLVDRLDSLSVRSYSRPPSRDRIALTPPEQSASQALSPIFQEDEPQTAKLDLENRVKNWRASASLTPTALALKQGQTSLEPANMPNTLPLDDSMETVGDGEINLEDFAWSVSSQGPGDDDEISITSWDRVPSVHLANRVEGSVCLTPTTATSFGPSDYTLPSPVASSIRLLTPDIAWRQFDDVPLTPSTATSWGPPSEYPSSPLSDGRVSSVDLAYRLCFSRPGTPSTATSWGPASWPASPMESVGRPRSIHLGDRGEFSRPPTPSTATSWGAPLFYPPSPATPFYVHTPDAGHRAFDIDDPVHTLPWAHGWPYNAMEPSNAPWIHSWPYRTARSPSEPWTHNWPYQPSVNTQVQNLSRSDSAIPEESSNGPWAHNWPYQSQAEGSSGLSNAPWSYGWPYLTRSPARPTSEPWTHNWPYQSLADNGRPWVHNWPYQSAPTTRPWKHGWPYGTQSVRRQISVMVTSYPYFNLYPAVYPHNLTEIYPLAQREPENHPMDGYPYNLSRIYPAVHTSQLLKVKGIDIRLQPSYPTFELYEAVYPLNLENIYPACSLSQRNDRPAPVYPSFNLYPAVSEEDHAKKTVIIQVEPSYPAFRLYSPVYPWNLVEIYPSVSLSEQVISVKSESSYPCFNLYPAVYPHLEIYPAIPIVQREKFVGSKSNNMSSGYPNLVLYPASTKETIVPSHEVEAAIEEAPYGGVLNRYPVICIYQNIYPFLEVYPALPVDTWQIDQSSGYPYLDIYPAVNKIALKSSPPEKQQIGRSSGYPYFNIYPAVSETALKSSLQEAQRVTKSSTPYPVFTLYEPVYPHMDIYPPVSGQVDSKDVRIEVSVRYPVFDLYSAVYPYLNIYSPVSGQLDYKHIVLDINAQYPVLNPYPAVYPHFELYLLASSVSELADKGKGKAIGQVRYPVFNLYPVVYPHLELYPPVSGEVDCKYIVIEAKIHYPFFDLYPAIYPYFELYLPVSGQVADSKDPKSLTYPACYPTFDLYPVVYPYFCLWPTIQPQMQPFSRTSKSEKLTHVQPRASVTSQSAQQRARRSTKSHAQLHREVLESRRPVIQVKIKKASKTHRQLHQEVFPGFTRVHTPSGTFRKSVSFETEDMRTLDMGINDSAQMRITSGSISSRPLSSVSPTRGLPPRPNYRLSTIGPAPSQPLPPRPQPEVESSHNNSPSASPISQPLRRSISSASSFSSRLPTRSSPTHLAPVDEQGTGGVLSRSISLSVPSRRPAISRYEAPEAPETSAATPSRYTPRKRESLVLQRVRAINATSEEDPSSISSLSKKFPMPPRPPLPPLPTRPS
ncbi:salivary gland secretion 1 [Moniliophthora roreri MCA 2997]|uniref:Salivary gland secretion 1 n=2 Tax=Moniliophthora roreri TaxID=221103 RepID=V2XQL7_MONRO|nr:salivary gland secretion 1 [Moniliophthora roreri MCA 2997]KAI3612318.1 salivary gland secretion 1 [Moniliophthora roreri]